MPINAAQLAAHLQPEQTVLFFGSGATVPSGAPSVDRLVSAFAKSFNIDQSDLTLREITSLIEQERRNRRELIASLRAHFHNLRPAGGLLNLPLYPWNNIYTTNYDTLIEGAYAQKKSTITPVSSNFDFTSSASSQTQTLFKLHGTIEKDISDGIQSRIVLTDEDYTHTHEYREALYERLKLDCMTSQLVIIGHSLADPHIRELVDRAIAFNSANYRHRSVTLFMYERNENRASLLEAKGLQVAFGGIDEFFIELARHCPQARTIQVVTGNPLDAAPELNASTKDVSHARSSEPSNLGGMFNGAPARYSDIDAGFTFQRSVIAEIADRIEKAIKQYIVLTGASGVGKTTLARQALLVLLAKNFHAWEHDAQIPFVSQPWIDVARRMTAEGQRGLLFVDDAGVHLPELNKLVDTLGSEGNKSLFLLVASSQANWSPRIKSSFFFRQGETFRLSKLDSWEIDALLTLVEKSQPVNALVEQSFKGFSRHERRRRLVERCESDFFVCLRNVFASEKFDDIILHEYASLDPNSREIYKVVATLQGAGVTVHRQLIVRLINIPSDHIGRVLSDLSDVVEERTVSSKAGIYAWVGRHQVISEIIARYKFADQDSFFNLLSQVIRGISPTYGIEVQSLVQLCSSDWGIRRISSQKRQNELYRMVMSIVPGERVPRHRLIRNLVASGAFDEATTEIRIFEADFREDGPVARYKIDLMLARAKSKGLLDEDRVAILRSAIDFSATAVTRFSDNKYVLNAHGQIGLEWYKLTGDLTVFDSAMDRLREAQDRVGDPEITTMINRLNGKFSAPSAVNGSANGDASEIDMSP